MNLKMFKNGHNINVYVPTKKFTKTKMNEPIGTDRILGIDTESLLVNNELKTVLVPFASYKDTISDISYKEDIDPIVYPLRYCMDQFGEVLDRPYVSIVDYREQKGTREKIKPLVWVFYNMEYDLQRLFNSDSLFFRYVRQYRNNIKWNLPGTTYQVQFVQCNPTGNGASFQLICYCFESKKVIRIYGLDMWSYWKTGLSNSAKQLGLGEKIGIEKNWFSKDLNEFTKEEFKEFVEYSKKDSELTRDLYIATANLLGNISLYVFNRNGILPASAPASSAKIAFNYCTVDTFERPPKAYEQLALNAYHGGYVATLEKGQVNNINIIDLNSAYPSAMVLLPNPANVVYEVIDRATWFKPFNQPYGFVCATFNIKDGVRFPAVSKHHKQFTLHQTGIYVKHCISICELNILFELKQIEEAQIHYGYYLVDKEQGDNRSFLKTFIEKFYKMKKESESGSPNYLASKLLMNSLYGKLIEVHENKIPALIEINDLNHEIYHNGKIDKNVINELAQVYVDEDITGLLKYSRDQVNKAGEDQKNLNKITVEKILTNKENVSGFYFLPIYASLITAIARAKLCVLTNLLEAVACDTDSVFTYISPASILFNDRIEEANNICLRNGLGSVNNDKELQGFSVELIGANGFIAGIKQYHLETINGKYKGAYHCITNPSGDTKEERLIFLAKAIRDLSLGNIVTYKTKAKPVRLKEALLKNTKTYGLFESEDRVIESKEDTRLEVVSEMVNKKFYQFKNIKGVLENE